MESVLIASLGESPGVITALVDALKERRIEINRVIPVYIKPAILSNNEPPQITELEKEFKEYYKGKISFDYRDKYVVGSDIGSKNEKDRASSDDFFRKAIEIINNVRRDGHCIIVGIGGGRKTMSALMTYAALINDVQHIYQIMVSDDIENIGRPNDWIGNKDVRERALHPKPDERWLVKLPTRSEIANYCDRIQNEGVEVVNNIIFEQNTGDL